MNSLMDKGDIYLLSRALKRRDFSAEELTRAYLERIEGSNADVKAYITVCEASAVAAAREVDRRRASGEALGTLAGLPYAAKDNICVCNVAATCGSRMLEDYISPYSATVVKRLEAECAVMLGKTNMDEFAMGSVTDTSFFGVTKNPLDTSRIAGGSSGGSAAAVAARQAAYALGSDTGGSVRQPSAYCGAVGIKPTYGTVSRYGLVAFAPSLEQIAPITADVRSNALVLSYITGIDEKDNTSIEGAGELLAEIEDGVSGLRLGVDMSLLDGAAPDVRDAVLGALSLYERLGARTVEIKLPNTDAMLAAYYVISSSEASSNMARYDGIRYGRAAKHAQAAEELYIKSRTEGFGDEVKRRIMLGTYFLNHTGIEAYYKKAFSVRKNASRLFNEIFCGCDAILSPVTPTVAYRLADRRTDPLAIYREDIYTVMANLTGLPALSVPCGRGEGGMPVGLQIMGKALSEAMLYRIAYALEREVNTQ